MPFGSGIIVLYPLFLAILMNPIIFAFNSLIFSLNIVGAYFETMYQLFGILDHY